MGRSFLTVQNEGFEDSKYSCSDFYSCNCLVMRGFLRFLFFPGELHKKAHITWKAVLVQLCILFIKSSVFLLRKPLLCPH